MFKYQSEAFLGQEINNCLNNLQIILNNAEPWTKKLVLDKKLRETIIKYVKTIQTLLCEFQDNRSRWEEERINDCQNQINNYSPQPNNTNNKKIKIINRLKEQKNLAKEIADKEISNIKNSIQPSPEEDEYNLLERLCKKGWISEEIKRQEVNNLYYE